MTRSTRRGLGATKLPKTYDEPMHSGLGSRTGQEVHRFNSNRLGTEYFGWRVRNASWNHPNRKRTEPANRTEPNWTGPCNSEPNRPEPDRTGPNRTEPEHRTGPNRPEPDPQVRTEPDPNEPNRTEPDRSKPQATDRFFEKTGRKRFTGSIRTGWVLKLL